MCVQNIAVGAGTGESAVQRGKGGRLLGEPCREHLGTPTETSLGELLEGWAGPSC